MRCITFSFPVALVFNIVLNAYLCFEQTSSRRRERQYLQHHHVAHNGHHYSTQDFKDVALSQSNEFHCSIVYNSVDAPGF